MLLKNFISKISWTVHRRFKPWRNVDNEFKLLEMKISNTTRVSWEVGWVVHTILEKGSGNGAGKESVTSHLYLR